MAIEILLIFLLTILFPFLYDFLCSINRAGHVPVNWPVIGMLPGLVVNFHHFLDSLATILGESELTFVFKGPWFCGMDFLLTCDPANANHIFNTRFDHYAKGEDFMEYFEVLGDGLLRSEGDLWKIQRRMAHTRVNNNLQFRSLVAECSREKVANGLLPLLSEMDRSDRVFDLEDVFKRYTFDVLCQLVLAVDPCSLAPNFPTVPFADALVDVEHALFLRHTVPRFWWRLKKLAGIGMEKRLATGWKVIDQFLAQRIAERRELGNDQQLKKQRNINKDHRPIHSDLLTMYLDHDSTDDLNHTGSHDFKEYFKTDKFLRDTLLTFLGAGLDNTGAALSWFFHLLSMNPNVEKKILQELCQVRSKVACGEMVVFDSYEEIESLVYLHAALCESMRLFPPLPFNHKNANKAGVLPSGHKVRPGTMIIYSMYAMGRMESIWGKDCCEFKPERWISDDGKLKHEPSYKYMVFGCGPRTCVGKSVAFTLTKIAAAGIIYNFQVEAAKGHTVEPLLAIALSMKNGFMVKMKKRESMEA